jgi:hypothetical protein
MRINIINLIIIVQENLNDHNKNLEFVTSLRDFKNHRLLLISTNIRFLTELSRRDKILVAS